LNEKTPARVNIEVPAWVGALIDPGVRAAVVLVVAAAAGFALVGLSWATVAARIYVPLQLPFLISGAFTGIAVTGGCLALLAVHLERRAAAADRQTLDRAIRGFAELVDRRSG
jgi:hypothetical protein